MNVELDIKELVLHGVDVRDRARLGASVEAELARLLTEQGLPPSLSQGGYTAHLDGGTIHLAPGAPAEGTGAQVAGAVYGGLDR
jgi:hypothetical protein